MKKVIFRSVYDAFDYVMDHFYPFGLEELAQRKDTYAVISIQDTHTGGFGLQFTKNRYCRDVLTLGFDDITGEVEGAVLFSESQAEEIISFIERNREAETLLVHCYGGESRSRAAAAFALEMLGGRSDRVLSSGHANGHVLETLRETWKKREADDGSQTDP